MGNFCRQTFRAPPAQRTTEALRAHGITLGLPAPWTQHHNMKENQRPLSACQEGGGGQERLVAQGPLPGFWPPGLLPWPSCLITVCRDPRGHHHSDPGRREKGRLPPGGRSPASPLSCCPRPGTTQERGHASIVTLIHMGTPAATHICLLAWGLAQTMHPGWAGDQCLGYMTEAPGQLIPKP